MEPRPQRPSRATGPYISTGTPSPGSSGTGSNFGQPVFDASGAPPAGPPAIGYDPDYSPGQPLTPLRGPRGANIIGPLLAVAALAIIVAAVAFIVTQFRSNDDNNGANPTAVVAANASPTDETELSAGGDGAETPASEDEATTPPDDAGNGDDPTSTPRVNRTTESSGDLSATEESTVAEEESAEKTKARQWFPTEREVGEGFTKAEDDTRTADDVAAAFPDPEDAAVKIVEFGWVENAFRNYERTGASETEAYSISISIHKFDTEGGASDALDYFSAGGQAAQGLIEVKGAPELGEESISLQGFIEGGNLYVVYIRQGNFLFRIGGLSATGDPAETTVGVAERILAE